jgi:hypothetical protein
MRDQSHALDVERLARRAAQPDFQAALTRSGIRSFAALLAHELLPLDVLHGARLEGPVHTLLHPRLSYLAARAFFSGGQATLPFTGAPAPARVGRENSLVRRWAARLGGELAPEDRKAFVAETCKQRPLECATLLADWAREQPASPLRERFVERVRERAAVARGDALTAMARLAPLFDAGPLDGVGDAASDSRAALRRAHQATRDYKLYYHHAAPFEPRSLLALWDQCAALDRDGKACRDGRGRAERLLGPHPD